MPDDAPWPEPVVIPDDLRELQADIDSYHRERRAAARRRRIARVTGTRWWQRYALPVGVALGSVSLAAVVLGVLTFGHPRPDAPPRPEPIAAPAVPDGQLHGLLPDATVRENDRFRSIRSFRPALVALVPLHCDCTSLLASLATQANEVAARLVVVAPGAQDAELDTLGGQLHRGTVVPVFDAAGELAAMYSTGGVTALVVRPDATVGFIQTDVQQGSNLEPQLGQLLRPDESLSST